MKRIFPPAIIAVAMLASSHFLQAAEEDKDPAALGRALAERHCARCHAVADEPASPHKDAPPFRTFSSRWPLENLEEALAEGIVTGHPDMPAFVFEPEEIDALIEYLQTLALEAPQRQ
ncbi:MAG: hypothetical protein Kow0032_01350 [Methyloligellaceae bacterium]